MNEKAGRSNGKTIGSYPIEEGSIPSPATNMGANVPRRATDPCKVREAGSIPVASTIYVVAPVPRDDRPIKWGDGTGEMPI